MMQAKSWLFKSGAALSLMVATHIADAQGHGTHHRTQKIHLAAKAGALHKVRASHHETGIASFYSDKFHGRRTASGELYDRNMLTAQHAHLPFGTIIKVTNLRNHRSVHVKVNDRGGHVGRRVLDLSHRAAKELGFVAKGLALVKVEVVGNTPG